MGNNEINIDDKDKKILSLLKENSKLSTGKISKKLNLPVTTVFHRIKKLEKNNVIKKYTINVNEEKLGKHILAWVFARVGHDAIEGVGKDQEELAKETLKLENVIEVYTTTGTTDLLIKVIAKDIKELNEFLIKRLRKLEGIQKTETSIVLNGFFK